MNIITQIITTSPDSWWINVYDKKMLEILLHFPHSVINRKFQTDENAACNFQIGVDNFLHCASLSLLLFISIHFPTPLLRKDYTNGRAWPMMLTVQFHWPCSRIIDRSSIKSLSSDRGSPITVVAFFNIIRFISIC